MPMAMFKTTLSLAVTIVLCLTKKSATQPDTSCIDIGCADGLNNAANGTFNGRVCYCDAACVTIEPSDCCQDYTICIDVCTVPSIPFGRISCNAASVRAGVTCGATCNPGYELASPGMSSIRCENGGEFRPFPVCQEVRQCPIPRIANAAVRCNTNTGSVPVGATCSVQCVNGFDLGNGNQATTIRCLQRLNFGQLPTCRRTVQTNDPCPSGTYLRQLYYYRFCAFCPKGTYRQQNAGPIDRCNWCPYGTTTRRRGSQNSNACFRPRWYEQQWMSRDDDFDDR